MHLKSDLIRGGGLLWEWPDKTKRVAFGGSGLIRWLVSGGCGLIRWGTTVVNLEYNR